MRAYSVNRPIGLGTWPSQHRDKVVGFHHFDAPTYIPEIRRNSFGYIEFGEDVPKEDLDEYEMLVPEWCNPVPDSVVRALWEASGDDERFDRRWEIALRKYGEDELAEAFDRGYERYGRHR